MILSVCPNPSVDTYWNLHGPLQGGKTHRIGSEQRFPGGKGIHVALAVAELGEPSELLGFWAGSTGDWLRDQCGKLGVTCHGPYIPGMNRTCLTLRTDDAAWRDTEFLGPGPRLLPEDYQAFLHDYEKLLDQASIVVLSGSWPPGAPADPYGPMIDLANSRGIPVWLDCSGDVLQQALPHKPYGLHLNKKEATEGLPPEYGDAAEEYYLQFVQALALTAGKDGLYLSTPAATIHASCRLEQIVSAVGSGDCLTAGLAVGHYRGNNPEQMARLGAGCGSANCLREDLGMLYRKDVEELLGRVVVSIAP
jgi:1-phosphofructokinase family hexose kinase